MYENKIKKQTGTSYSSFQQSNYYRAKTSQKGYQRRSKQKAGTIRGLSPRRSSSLGKIITRPYTPNRKRSLCIQVQVQTMSIKPMMENKGIQVEDMDDIIIQKPLCQTQNINKCLNAKNNRQTLLQMADMNYINQQFEKYAKSIKAKYQTISHKNLMKQKQNEKQQQKNIYKQKQKQKQKQKRQQIFRQKSILIKQKERQKQKQKQQQIIKQKYRVNQRYKQKIETKMKFNVDSPCRQIKLFKQNINQKLEIDRNCKKMLIQNKQRSRSFREQKIEKLSAAYEKNLAKYQTNKKVLQDLLTNNKLR